MQGCPAYAAARVGPEWCVDVPVAVQVADAVEWLALWINTESPQLEERVWHQPFTAGLVDGSAAPFDDDNVKTRHGAVQCGGQSGRATASDKQIDHVNLASAAFSTLIRAVSSAAFSAEKATAVIQAVCTRGSAIPSATTAT